MTVTIGTISHGTLRTLDLINAFLSTLEEIDPARFDDLMALSGDVAGAWRLGWLSGPGEDDDHLADEWVEEATEWLHETIWPAMEEAAPEGTFFGASEGDGSDFGFWPIEDGDL